MKQIQNGSIVVPGEELGVIEEFIPSNNVFELDGRLFSTIVGTVDIDLSKSRISVHHPAEPVMPKRGDFGIAQITGVRNQVANVFIFHLRGKDLPIPFTGNLHIANASRDYVRSMLDVVRPGDWCRIEIIRGGIPANVSIVSPRVSDLGVVIGYCVACGGQLRVEFKGSRRRISCTNCELRQPRAVAKSYGQWNLDFHISKHNKRYEEKDERERRGRYNRFNNRFRGDSSFDRRSHRYSSETRPKRTRDSERGRRHSSGRKHVIRDQKRNSRSK